MSEHLSKEWINQKYHIFQPKKGYRFNMDSVLLGSFTPVTPGQSVLDIGTGSGVLPLLLLSRVPDLKILGVEIQNSLANMAQQTMRENNLKNVEIIQADVREMDATYHNYFELVISNPPYFKRNAGIENVDEMERVARHEVMLNVSELMDKAYKMMRPKGVFCCIYPISRLQDVLLEADRLKLRPRRLRMIHAYVSKPARAFLFQASKDAGQTLTVESPLILHHSDGRYTEELQAIMRGDRVDEKTR